MSPGRILAGLVVVVSVVVAPAVPLAQDGANSAAAKVDPRVDGLKGEVAGAVDGMATFTQQMVDQIFSYGELGFQEQETHRYLVDLLKRTGSRSRKG